MIIINEIEKSFARLPVLKRVSTTLEAGRVTAIVGSNGSGKTTLIKIILGLVRPDGGTLTVNGTAVNGDPSYKKAIGYMPQIARYPENLSVGEILRLVKDLRSGSGTLDEELYERYRLDNVLRKKVRTLSGGTRQKLSAAIAFLFNPQILILDEPTAGLDPAASGILKEKIHQVRAAGRTVILTSHIMSELEELADRLVFLQDGRIFYNGQLQRMITETGETRLERAIARMMKGDAA